MNFLLWIVIGGIAGWVASLIMKTREGILLNIIVGIVGGLIGGWVLGLLGVSTAGAGLFASFLTALLGACLLLAIVKLITGRRSVTR